MNAAFNDLLNKEKSDSIAMLSQVAHMYYDLGMLQPEIAEKLYFSRAKVSRMLQKAQDLGIVEIKVKRYLARVESYERKLHSLFNLKQAIVMTSLDKEDVEDAEDGLANYAAMYVSNLIKGAFVLGITGSHTVTNVVHRLKRMHSCNLKVVQTIGATISTDMSSDLAGFLANTYDGTAYFLNTPVYVDDLYVKETLLHDPAVREAMDLMTHCNLLLMGIGKFDIGGDMPHWSGYMTARHREEMARLGAVGSLCAQFFDINGKLLNSDWNQKCIAIPWEDIQKADLRIGVVSGASKALSILGALRGGLLDVLFIDNITAARVIEEQQRLLKAGQSPA